MWQYRILETGFFYADGGAMFGAIPKRAWKRKYPSNTDNCCILAMNCVLLWNKDYRILVDTGVGNKNLGKLSYYHFHDLQSIEELLRKQGLTTNDITDVILSHLHFDHCGGCTYEDSKGGLKISFPNARHHIGKDQWLNYLNPNPLEENSFRKEDILPVEKAGLINLIDTDLELYPGLTIGVYDGHTAGQLVPLFISDDSCILIPGDVIPSKAHLSDDWISAYDIHPLKSLSAKRSLKERIKNNRSDIIFYHDAYNKFINYTLKV